MNAPMISSVTHARKPRTTMPHLAPLDGLRAMAIIIVYLSHAGLGSVVPGGFGVTVFFFLSGFLITSLLRTELESTGTISFKGFYLRRLLRINPPLWVSMMLVGVLVATGVVSAESNTLGVVSQALFFSNYAEIYAGAQGLPGMPLWSLAVEEHFYLVFPVLFLLASRLMSSASVGFCCIIVCGLVLLIRFFYVFVLGDTYSTYYLTHTRVDSILFGCILALWQNPILDDRAWQPRQHHVMLAIASILTTIVIRSPMFRETVRYSIQGASLFVLFSAVLRSTGLPRRILVHPWLRKVGLYSYSTYLVHLCFLLILSKWVTHGSLVASGILGILPTWAYTAAMYATIEKPLSVWRRRMQT